MPRYIFDICFFVKAADEESAKDMVKTEIDKITTFEVELDFGPYKLNDEE